MNHHLSDFMINLQQIELLAPKMNQGISIIFVIHGELTVETNSRFYQLKEKDILVINRNQLFQAKGNKKNHVLLLQISDSFMKQRYEAYPNSRFECFSGEVDMARDTAINQIRKLLAELIITYFRKGESYQIEILSYISDILLILIRRFKQKGTIQEKVDTRDPRLMQIIHFIKENYDQKITLEDVAEKFYL